VPTKRRRRRRTWPFFTKIEKCSVVYERVYIFVKNGHVLLLYELFSLRPWVAWSEEKSHAMSCDFF
jgi:hypothetical protein